MDLDTFLAAPKWDILKIISLNPSSPIEIAEVTKTTVSYVSQQLKLLEAAGVVKKIKTGAYEKGKPRNVYSICNEFSYFTVLTNGFSEKKKLMLDTNKKIIFKIWCLENPSLHMPLLKFFLLIEDLLSKINKIYLKNSKSKVELIIYSNKENLSSEISNLVKKIVPEIDFSVLNFSIYQKNSHENLYSLYENFDLVKNEQSDKLKGGIEK
jgi:DNA-binding transcriptional regulator GbsR (MarR family)